MAAGDDELVQFRTTWMQAVALAWVDDKFKGELLSDAKKALKDTFNYGWTWNTLGFTVKPADDFTWIGDQWVWPDKELDKLTLSVPLNPGIPVDDHARALADYYAMYTSLFHGNAPTLGAAHFQLDTLKAVSQLGQLLPQVVAAVSMPSLKLGNEGPTPTALMPTQGSFMDFQVALLSAMAKAWENEAFRELIVESPTTAVRATHGYTMPWSLSLVITDAPNAKWDKDTRVWTDGAAHNLTLCLPASPEKGRDQTLAIAAYNSTGACFPFTCCA